VVQKKTDKRREEEENQREANILILNVGCGGSERFKPRIIRGSFNCDVLKPRQRIPNFVQCDALNLPFQEEIFDGIIMFHIIEHLENPLRALQEAKRVLKGNGDLELRTPNALYLPKIVRSIWKGTYIPTREHIMTWGKPELENFLALAGFNCKVRYGTSRDPWKPWYYELLIRICPFPAIKHRELRANGRKV